MDLWMLLSPFAVALVGAGIGAWTAQHIAARNKRIDERMKEVRAASAATTIAYGIVDHFLSMKEQIVKPTLDRFVTDRENFVIADAAPKPPGITQIIWPVPLDAFRFNLSPSKELQAFLFNDLSPQLRAMFIIAILTRTLAMLDKLCEDRNQLVKDFKENQDKGKAINPFAYYGLPFPTGGADMRYRHTLESIASYTDDAIRFSEILGDDLRELAVALRETLPRYGRPLAPRIMTVKGWKNSAMLPDATKYKDYDELYRPVRALGAGHWHPKFEALALAQYQDTVEHWVA